MNPKDVPLFLDSMLAPHRSEYARNIDANKKLSQQEKNILISIVADFETQEAAYNYNAAFQTIDGIMKRVTAINAAGGSVANPTDLPFLIMQVLFYMSFACILYKVQPNQKTVLASMGACGINVSHNFFSRMEVTPAIYRGMAGHKLPDLPINYKGQKKGELAVAIKYLAYQAGKYKCFCDIFGGSGAATFAVERRSSVDYVYNDLDALVVNLMEVMKDNRLYKDLIDEISNLQWQVWDESRSSYFSNINFRTEIRKYHNSRNGNIAQEEQDILQRGNAPYYFNKTRVKALFADMRDFVNYRDNQKKIKWPFKYNGKKYYKVDVFNNILLVNPVYTTKGALKDMDLLEAFCAYCSYPLDSSLFGFSTPQCSDVGLSWGGRLVQLRQYRFYLFYAYFCNVLNDFKNGIPISPVRLAVAFIFMLTVSHWQSNDVAAIVNLYGNIYNHATEPYRFLKKDYASIIKGVHNLLNKVTIESKDFLPLIQKYQGKKFTLFYSDSPYLYTSGYDPTVLSGEAGKKEAVSGDSEGSGSYGGFETGFGEKEMNDLIDALFAAANEKKDKFIFSCRAAMGSARGSETTNELRKRNRDLKTHVFDYMNGLFGGKLWVLAFETDKSLADQLKGNFISEIMITNYEITDFTDILDYGAKKDEKGKKNKISVYKVYTFANFINVWLNNANY